MSKLAVLEQLEAKRAAARIGGGEKRIAAQHAKGKLTARERLHILLDEDSFEEWFTDLWPVDPLEFKDRLAYSERLAAEQAKTGMNDAAVVGRGYSRGRPVVFPREFGTERFGTSLSARVLIGRRA